MTEPLRSQAKELADSVAVLTVAVEQLDRRTNRSERITIGVVFGLLLDLVLSVAVAVVLANQVSISERVATAVEREAHTREDALCPVFGLLLGNYNPESRPAGPGRDQYIATFDVMRRSYDNLSCPGGIVPPAAPR